MLVACRYEYCFMRYYSSYNFIGDVDTREDASVTLRRWPDMDNPKAFQKVVGKAMVKATTQAVSVGGNGLGRAKEQYTPFVSVYALAQCTRDLPSLTRLVALRRGAKSTIAAVGHATKSSPSISHSKPTAVPLLI